jgi:hypothetical protein
MLPAKRLRQRAVRCGAPPCDPQTRKPPGHRSGRRASSRFLWSQLRRIGLGHPLQARPRSGQALSTAATVPEPELQPRPPLRTQRPRSPQARERGASPRRILVSLGGLLTAAAEPTPPRRSWMSPLGARPLADRFQTTTRRKSPTRSVTFLRDPTIPISVTWLNDLTRRQNRRQISLSFRVMYNIRSVTGTTL